MTVRKSMRSYHNCCKYVLPLFLFSLLVVMLSPVYAQQSVAEEEQAFYRSKHYIPIKGEQDSDYPKAVYVVTDDVTIKPDKTMTFMPGTVVLLKKDTRITVAGRLICQGTGKSPISFCRLENGKYLIPLDPSVDSRWDGVFVTAGGSVEFTHTNVSGSKYGVDADKAAGVVMLDSVSFRDNKFQNLQVAGKNVGIRDSQVIFFSSKAAGIDTAAEMLLSKSSKPVLSLRTTARISSGVVCAAGIILGIIGLVQNSTNYDLYTKANDPMHTNAADVALYRQRAESGRNLGIAGAVCAAVGAAGFIVTFTF